MSTSDDGDLFTKVLVILVLFVLLGMFALFNVGVSVAYLVKTQVWNGMTPVWFWGVTILVSLVLYLVLYALMDGEESAEKAPQAENSDAQSASPATMAGILYLSLNGGFFLIGILAYVLFGMSWFGRMFMHAFPFLQDSPLFN